MRNLREPVAGLTHLAGAMLGVPLLGVLFTHSPNVGSVRHVVGLGIFGMSLIALYLVSALYHLLPLSPRGIARLRRLDHAMIYVLIAGTYTPICLIALHGGWRWGLLGTVWGLALGGIALKVRWMHAPVWLSTALYVALGWLAIPAFSTLARALPSGAMAWLVLGGIIYTLGALVYGLKRPALRPGTFGAHELWHLFVLAGSACHVWVVARYLTPLP